MRRMPSNAQRNQTRRARPVIEGLEDRRLLSQRRSPALGSTAAASSGGVFSHNGTEFTYTTPTGGQAVIQVVGLGNLAGTTVDSSARSTWSTAGPTRTRRSSATSTAVTAAHPWPAS